MGFYMNLFDRKFNIKADNKRACFKAVMEHIRKYKDYYGDVSNCLNLKDAMERLDWELEYDENGDDVIGIMFNGEKLGEDFALFSAIAPFVTKGSFIEMTGDEASHWRWVFNGKTCIEKHAKVRW